jgi:hypothetical protein
MAIKDLGGFSKPFTRLIEVISKGCGTVFAAHFMRKRADAEAYRVTKIAQAVATASESFGTPITYVESGLHVVKEPGLTLSMETVTLEERSSRRVGFQEQKRQDRIEHVTSIAAEELADDEAVSSESPTEEWIDRFFSYAQYISNDQAQRLWGRVLAREVKRPGSFSLRALDTLRNLSKEEAEVFQKMVSAAVYTRGAIGDREYMVPNDEAWIGQTYGIYLGDHIRLSELGLMYAPTDISIQSFVEPSSTVRVFSRDPAHLLLLKRGEAAKAVQLPVWKLSGTGSELASLISLDLDLRAMQFIGSKFLSKKAEGDIYKITEYDTDGQPSAMQLVQHLQ